MNRLIGRSVAGAVVTATAAVGSAALSAGVLPPALARHPPASIASMASRDESLGVGRRHENPLKRTVIEIGSSLEATRASDAEKPSAVSLSRSVLPYQKRSRPCLAKPRARVLRASASHALRSAPRAVDLYPAKTQAASGSRRQSWCRPGEARRAPASL